MEAVDSFIGRMKDQGVTLNKEGSAEGFLGVNVRREGTTTTLSQLGLTSRIIEALGLCSKYTNPVDTPAERAPLPQHRSEAPYDGPIKYSSIVGMLLYLMHSRPDCAFAVHQCARFTFAPKAPHIVALKRIGRYLKGTQEKGLILCPTDGFDIDCYLDANFAGLYGHEDPQDPHCVRSRTGYVICLDGCPVIWRSSLQGLIAQSTMESEYVALSTACKDLFPIMNLVAELGGKVGIGKLDVAHIHVRVHEDNVGALTLGKLEPRRMTPRSKHYALKYHWFRS